MKTSDFIEHNPTGSFYFLLFLDNSTKADANLHGISGELNCLLFLKKGLSKKTGTAI